MKWLSKLEFSEEQAEGAWQRGLNYKVLPPSVLDAQEVNIDTMPGLGEVSVFSGITDVERTLVAGEERVRVLPGDTVLVKASGWAWAGECARLIYLPNPCSQIMLILWPPLSTFFRYELKSCNPKVEGET